MIYIKWLIFALFDLAMLPVWYLSAPFLSLFTAGGWPKGGTWFWTYDNPPQGDAGFIRERAVFCPAGSPFTLYVNRVWWLWRNPGYGLQKYLGLINHSGLTVTLKGDPRIGDKERRPGWYFARCVDMRGHTVAFEYYLVKPWSASKCLRVRLGWKIQSRKFASAGFAPLVNTPNPFKAYGS